MKILILLGFYLINLSSAKEYSLYWSSVPDKDIYVWEFPGEIEVFCEAFGGEFFVMRWFKNGRDVIEGSDKFKAVGLSGLKITVNDERDLGNFTCAAVHGFGKIEYDFTLRLPDVPKFKTRPARNVETYYGHPIRLYCQAEDNLYPPAQLKWFYTGNGENYPEEEEEIVFKHRDSSKDGAFRRGVADNGSLVFDWTMDSDQGCYECRLDNGLLNFPRRMAKSSACLTLKSFKDYTFEDSLDEDLEKEEGEDKSSFLVKILVNSANGIKYVLNNMQNKLAALI